ncbi:hypothetical protein SteCoe_22969 [Stentor coeruleus]|uniref:UBC core domain-containing protein n=1 Tax=Stentor coeruleus TaxID=5963 RepID=A0A1R2BL29_9CILI|nr:hypothetical protein SteCoe_22969 [Stentor coeruleus]
MSKKFISKRYEEFLEEKHEEFILTPKDESLLFFTGCIKGVKGTPYENGVFHFEMELPTVFPFKPPTFKFTTPIYHPNIRSSGNLSCNILVYEWSPVYAKFGVLLFAIQSFLDDPDPEEGFELKNHWIDNLEDARKTARIWTYLYAT